MTTADPDPPLEVRGPHFRAIRAPEGYVRIEYEPHTQVTGESALEELAACARVAAQVPTPILVDIRGVRSVARGARKAFAESPVPSRVAMFVDNSLTRTMANFFIGVARPEVPVKVFSIADDAIAWLLDHEG